jgi:hypothetical protein
MMCGEASASPESLPVISGGYAAAGAQPLFLTSSSRKGGAFPHIMAAQPRNGCPLTPIHCVAAAGDAVAPAGDAAGDAPAVVGGVMLSG